MKQIIQYWANLVESEETSDSVDTEKVSRLNRKLIRLGDEYKKAVASGNKARADNLKREFWAIGRYDGIDRETYRKMEREIFRPDSSDTKKDSTEKADGKSTSINIDKNKILIQLKGIIEEFSDDDHKITEFRDPKNVKELVVKLIDVFRDGVFNGHLGDIPVIVTPAEGQMGIPMLARFSFETEMNGMVPDTKNGGGEKLTVYMMDRLRDIYQMMSTILHECIHQHIYEYNKDEEQRVMMQGKLLIMKLMQAFGGKASPKAFRIGQWEMAKIQHGGLFKLYAEKIKDDLGLLMMTEESGYCDENESKKYENEFFNALKNSKEDISETTEDDFNMNDEKTVKTLQNFGFPIKIGKDGKVIVSIA